MPGNYLRGITELMLLSIFSLPVYAMEDSMAREVKGDVFVMTVSNRWERVYDNEKFNSAVRIKTERNSSVSLAVNNSLTIFIGENSILELNDMFSGRSNIISVGLFAGKSKFHIYSNEKRVYINTPFHTFYGSKGKFSLELGSDYSVSATPESESLFYVSDEGDRRISEAASFKITKRVDYKTCAKKIEENINRLKGYVSDYDRASEEFERLSESILSSKKNKSELKTQLNRTLKNIFILLLRINEAKNRINVFSTILRETLEQENLRPEGDDVEEINTAIENLRGKYNTVTGLKDRIGNIINSEIFTMLKIYDSITNGRKRH